ncbi:Glycoside hydrolase family 36 protein, partial [Teratosphaeria destructans]
RAPAHGTSSPRTPLHPFTLRGTRLAVAPLRPAGQDDGRRRADRLRAYVESNGRLRLWVQLKALGVLGIYVSDLAKRDLEAGMMVLMFGRPVSRGAVRVGGTGDRVLEIDVARAWAESGEEAGWSNEVSLEPVRSNADETVMMHSPDDARETESRWSQGLSNMDSSNPTREEMILIYLPLVYFQTITALQADLEPAVQTDSHDLVDVYRRSTANDTRYAQSRTPLHSIERQAPPRVVPANAEEVQVARCKGQMLLGAIADPTTSASVWTEEAEMDDYGWQKQTGVQAASEFEAVEGALDQFDIPGYDDPSWTTITWTMNGADYEGTWYPACNAFYTNIFNPAHGTIMATNNDGPAHLKPPQEPLVPLRQWSDVAFLTWQHLCEVQGVDVDDIERIVRVNIINDDTLELMLAVLQSERGIDELTDLGDFQNGEEFLLSDDGFDVLLGTPNASGVAWFLAQHKSTLGEKRITRITLWDNQPQSQREQYGAIPCMMIEFE